MVCCLGRSKDGNDHVADQNLAADYFAEFPSEFPTTATMLGALQRALPAASMVAKI